MLDVIRSKSHSLIIKLAFGIIILVFCFWGVGSFRGGPSTEILTVNGESVGIQELNQKLTQLDERIRSQRPDLTSEDLRKMGIKKQAAQELVFDTLLAQEAARLGLTVTPVELRKIIEGIPDFHNADGKFDPNLYQERLNGQRGETPGSFEKRIAGNFLRYKLQQGITAGAVVSEAEAKSVFAFGREQRSIEYALFPSKDHEANAAPKDADISAYYQAHQNMYHVPATADVTYLEISAPALAQKFKPTEAQAKDFYQKNIKRFSDPEKVKASHILIMVDKDADEQKAREAEAAINDIARQIAGGADFATLAKEKSQDPGSAAAGGDLGWFDRTTMVPEFSAAAFELAKDAVSKPFRTQFGWHIIKCLDKKAAGPRAFEQVRDAIDLELGTTEASGKVQDTLDQILLAVLGGKDIASAGKEYGLEPRDTGPLPANGLMTTMQIKKEDANLLLTTQPGTVRDTPIVTKTGYLLTKVNKVTAETTKPLSEVKDEIVRELTAENSAKLALKAAEEAYAKKETLTLTASEPFTRNSAVPAAGNGQDFYREVFSTPKGTWVSKAFPVDNGAIIARVKDVIPFDEKEWDKAREQVMPVLANARLQEQYTAFMQILQSTAKVMLMNKEILEK